MKQSSKIVAAVLALLLGSGAVMASGGHYGHGHGGMRYGFSLQHMIKKMDRHFDLSEQQQTALANLVEQNRDQMRANRMASRELRSQALTLDPTATDYDARVEEMVTRVSSLAGERTSMAADMYREVAAILTPEQFEEMRTMMAKRLENMQRRMEHRKKHGKEHKKA